MNTFALFKNKLINFYINSRGWRTERKIIVIESDDWGSIRMPSAQVYNKILKLGYPLNKLSYLKYDSLECNSDLESLFEILTSFKDINGNHPVITANTIMTNPDFDKIREMGFASYKYELFTETLKRYPDHEKVFDLYKRGLRENIFYPQLHGLEHININRWMKAIQDEKSNARIAFDHRFCDLSVSHTVITEDSFVDGLNPADERELVEQSDRILLASQLFDEVFGFKSITFVAPCYIWRPELEYYLNNIGIKSIKSGPYQKIPDIGKLNHYKNRIHYTGERNIYSQTYIVRNCFFEPSSINNQNLVSRCLKQINVAFKNKKPAIISSHRLNFIGALVRSNRDNNLNLFYKLLSKITETWPEVEFLNSEELSKIIQ